MELYKINEPRIQPYYHIDKQGNVYSLYNNRTLKLKPDKDKDGYLRVSLQLMDGRRNSFRINRLVALTFLPNPNDYPVVHHINNNKQDNCVDNLEWTTVAHNTQEGYKVRNYAKTQRVKSINLVTGEERIFKSLKECGTYYGSQYYDVSKIAHKQIPPHKSGAFANLDFMFIE